METAAGLFVLLTMSSAALAEAPPVLVGERDCRLVKLAALKPDQAVAWTGLCKDGYANGPGVLKRYKNALMFGVSDAHYEVTMVQGRISGEGKITYTDGTVYTGFFKDGVAHGNGYTAFSDGDQYEGGYKDGVRHGHGTHVILNGTTYTGEWKDDKRDGQGSMTFAVGGRYQGAWKADKFHGQGVIIYAGSGRRYEGLFEDGRAAGTPAPVQAVEGYGANWKRPSAESSWVREKTWDAVVPIDKSWSQLNPGQQAAVKSQYLALEPGDEPPYPIHGLKSTLDWLSKVRDHIDVKGRLHLLVLVGKDGNAVSVTRVGPVDPEMLKAATFVAMKEKYKSALCRGEPCEMAYPLALVFE